MLAGLGQIAALARLGWRLSERPDYAASLAMIPVARWLTRGYPARRWWGGRIRQLSIRITDRCNLRCHTCGQWGDHGYLRGLDVKTLAARELPAQRYLELLRQLAARGHRPSVYLWGGEPMLHAGSVEILEEAARLGMPPSIATNGAAVSGLARRLVAAPLALAQVSVDGPTAQVHNACRPGAHARADSFQAACQALEALGRERRRAGRRLPLIAALCTINQRNQDHLAELHQFLTDKADLVVYYLSWWIDQTRAREHQEDFHARFGFAPTKHLGWVGSWRPDDLGRLARELRAVKDQVRRSGGPAALLVPNLWRIGQLRTYYYDHRAFLGPRTCPAIFGAVEIDANGDLTPCRDYSDYVVGNIGRQSLLSLWNGPALAGFRRSMGQRGLMPVCARCCGRLGY